MEINLDIVSQAVKDGDDKKVIELVEKGFGGCMVGLIKRENLAKALRVPPQLEILLVLILGKPKEAPVIESTFKDGTNMSWVDDEGVRHIPKRSLDDIIVG